MTEAEYHNERTELSSTEARMILDSPARYRYKKDHPPLIAPSKKFDVGSAVHSKALGKGYAAVVIPPGTLATNGAASTKAAKDFIQDARSKGLIPLKEAEFQPVVDMAEAVLANRDARQLFMQPADPEVTVITADPVTGTPVRARFDFLPTVARLGTPSRVAVDLKTCLDASPRGFAKSVASYRYDIQHAWYMNALLWETGETAEMVFVAVEKEPPHLVKVHQLPSVWASMGATEARHALNTYAQCVESGDWPGYGDGVNLLDPPNWLIYEHEEKYGNE